MKIHVYLDDTLANLEQVLLPYIKPRYIFIPERRVPIHTNNSSVNLYYSQTKEPFIFGNTIYHDKGDVVTAKDDIHILQEDLLLANYKPSMPYYIYRLLELYLDFYQYQNNPVGDELLVNECLKDRGQVFIDIIIPDICCTTELITSEYPNIGYDDLIYIDKVMNNLIRTRLANIIEILPTYILEIGYSKSMTVLIKENDIRVKRYEEIKCNQ